jgi:lipid II:glycine glycyltransferase (peptidoglycan interpeptide bridge formation enzyme)
MKNSLSVRACTPDEYGAVLDHVPDTARPVSFLQAPFYGAWQARDGKTVVYFCAEDAGQTIAAGLAIKYDAPGGISFFYCPYGPVVTEWSPELLSSLRGFLTQLAREHGAAFVRLDSETLHTSEGVSVVSNKVAATASLQPRAEWLLDITPDQETLWMALSRHARYNVRLAERADATLEVFAPAEAPLDTFMELMGTTAGRDKFGIQSRQYYEAVLQSVPAENGFISLCSIDDKPAAVALFVHYDGVLHYVFAGSSDEFRKIAPPYFVIWNAVLEAKKRGLHTPNFGGISDDVKGQHLAGVTSFKKRFGGYAVTHSNPVDFAANPLKYAAFKLYKHLRG